MRFYEQEFRQWGVEGATQGCGVIAAHTSWDLTLRLCAALGGMARINTEKNGENFSHFPHPRLKEGTVKFHKVFGEPDTFFQTTHTLRKPNLNFGAKAPQGDGCESEKGVASFAVLAPFEGQKSRFEEVLCDLRRVAASPHRYLNNVQSAVPMGCVALVTGNFHHATGWLCVSDAAHTVQKHNTQFTGKYELTGLPVLLAGKRELQSGELQSGHDWPLELVFDVRYQKVKDGGYPSHPSEQTLRSGPVLLRALENVGLLTVPDPPMRLWQTETGAPIYSYRHWEEATAFCKTLTGDEKIEHALAGANRWEKLSPLTDRIREQAIKDGVIGLACSIFD